MSIGFDDGVSEFHTTTAHAPHELALPALMQILTTLADANAADSEYVLQWNRNPEEFDFRFVRDKEDLLLEIYQFPTDERHAMERELVFAAFAETFEQLYLDRDTDEFEFNWRQPFPHKEFEEFRAKMLS
jgi:hypothetical protein